MFILSLLKTLYRHIDRILLSTPDVVSNNIIVPESTKELLCKLTFLYRYNDVTTRELISKSIKGKNVIDEKLLINNFSAYYKFESNNLLPTIQKKIQPINPYTNASSELTRFVDVNSENIDLIYETYQFLLQNRYDLH